MNGIVKRIAAGTAQAAAPVLVARGAATASHAETTVNRNNGSSISQPSPHTLFPSQDFSIVTPGTWAHHQHQMHHGRR
jgi:hypothetical protein